MGNEPKPRDHQPTEAEALEEAKRIMKRLTEMPHKPHKPPTRDTNGRTTKER
jgi:hypothetical protein